MTHYAFRSHLGISVLAMALAALFPAASPAQPPKDATGKPSKDPSPVRVILISCDGTRPDAITTLGEEKVPSFYRLRKEGAFTDNARTDYHYTVTLPNHTCMVTSRGVTGKQGHHWIKNSDPKLGETLHSNNKSYVSSMFEVAHDYGLRTALFASKSKFSLYDVSYDSRSGAADNIGEDNGRDKLDFYQANPDTAVLMDAMIEEMGKHPFDLMMLHLRNPDSAGHASGWDLTPGSDYLNAVAALDPLLGKLLTAVETLPAYKGNTYLVLTADHGGWLDTKGHGEFDQPDNFTIPFYVWGPGVKPGGDLYAMNPETRKAPGKENPTYGAATQPIRNGDAGNLLLKLLGLPAIPGSTINSQQDLVVTAPVLSAP